MKTHPILLCRVSWMDRYQGTKGDSPHSGAAYIKRNRYGAEIFNFERIGNRLYGYFNHVGELKLERLGAQKNDQLMKGVTVVWCAPHPRGGVYVVGWYQDATVFRNYDVQPEGPRTRSRLPGRTNPAPFRCIADVPNAKLIDSDGRWFRVPDRFVSQSLTRYLDDESASTARFKARLLELTGGKLKPPVRSEKAFRNTNPVMRLKVERAAVNAARLNFENLGWQVRSVEAEDCGWDLTATRGRQKLHIEVKGRSGSTACAELTPNEYRYFRRRKREYRLCIVTMALEQPTLQTLYWKPKSKRWIAHDTEPTILERKGAIITLNV